ncbi:histidine triad nucleotide-binding protein [Paenibacillus sp. CAA11]|uniref:histidine triad nucleotide-binding protein n=1 Tax=Paenibacillus sp. CAA11 TaxID=1532905 RepID=UPI000D348259|nr:histidine triad nucleotide-binding protein [Paenibacillus sp. CAA11]AWB45411.1 histidine triad nucleotide-binding protein [Paenibacillus sp. CAA11]
MDCLFCKIAEGTIPSNKVYEDEKFLVFHDIQPAAPTHVLIIPKKHIATMNDAEGADFELIGELHKVAQEAAKKLGIAETGYRLINNCGPDGEQSVYHIHYHLLGGARLGALTGISSSHA